MEQTNNKTTELSSGVGPEKESTAVGSEENAVDLYVDWRREFTTVTPFSRVLAAVLFIMLPFAGFVLGVKIGGQMLAYDPNSDYFLPIQFVPDKPPTSLFSSDKPTVEQANETGYSPEALAEMVVANNDYAFTQYANLRDGNADNIFFSPYSISTALSMVYEGAVGETAAEIQNVFGLITDSAVRRPATARLYNLLNPRNADYQLSTANALWVQQDYQLLPSYTEPVKDYYRGYATNLDFLTATEASRLTINDWVEEKTNDKIKDLFPSGSINGDTRLVLTNAIYFKGDWLQQFDSSKTQDEEFTTAAGQVVMVPMMRHTDDAEYRYMEAAGLQMLELPYKGEELSMLVLLPDDNETGLSSDRGLSMLEESLSAEQLRSWEEQLREREVDVFLPRFKLETKYSLNDSLALLGMPSAFNPSVADFSGMSGARDLYISSVIHQAFVEVNEEGTEAAAATGVVMTGMAMPMMKPLFRADHPFLFLIKDNETGAVLFMGRVVDPS
jgi:serpin B